VAAAREGAQPAGEADPYRVPADAGEDFAGDESAAQDPRDSAAEDPGGKDPGDVDPGDEDLWDGDFTGGLRAGQPGENDHLAETPAPRQGGAGYSRS